MKDTKITVLDGIPGSGKTTWAINYMNENSDKKFMFITPFLEEVDRIKDATKEEFIAPTHKGEGKLEDLYYNLLSYKNIVATHKLFQGYDNRILEALKKNKYILILDEVMEVLKKIETEKDDIKYLLEKKSIEIDENNYVHWIDTEYKEITKKYRDIKTKADNGNLIYVNDTLLMWAFPTEIFNYFDEVYILTYMFNGQIMKHYYDFYNVKYKKMSVIKENSKYKLAEYSKQHEINYINQYKKLINIYDGKLNDIGNKHRNSNPFSVTWYKNIDNNKFKTIKKNIENYYKNIVKSKVNYNMWTTFKDYETRLKGKGYTKHPLANEMGYPLKDKNGKTENQKCFIPYNCRATNKYRYKQNLVYLCNVFVLPDTKQFFYLKNIEFNEDEYALSELIQWIFRSRIRNNQSINIYIPSVRMRGLLFNWLNVDKKDINNVA